MYSSFSARLRSSRQLARQIALRLTGCLAMIAILMLSACGDDNNGIHLGGGTTGGNGGVVTPSKEITARMETPKVLTDGSTMIRAYYTEASGGREVLTYSLEYSKAKYHSRWVAFRFDGDTRARNVSRSDEPFADDPSLSDDLKIGSWGFGSPYNRGHLCASADRLYSREANEQTFYMTNMSPQLGSFNQAYWVTLEGLVQRLGRDASFADTLYVVKGGTIRDNQIMSYVTRQGGKRVPVPKYYFMALLKVKNGTYSSIAFWIEHKEYGYDYKHQAPLSVIAKQSVSVNRLEELTGIDFFPNLPDKIEESVEDQYLPANWGM